MDHKDVLVRIHFNMGSEDQNQDQIQDQNQTPTALVAVMPQTDASIYNTPYNEKSVNKMPWIWNCDHASVCEQYLHTAIISYQMPSNQLCEYAQYT